MSELKVKMVNKDATAHIQAEERNRLALKVAEKEGWDFMFGNGKHIEFYQSYNGLMPIVDKINEKAREQGGLMIEIALFSIDIYRYNKTTGKLKCLNDYRLANDSLLDALLQAVHYVLTNKSED